MTEYLVAGGHPETLDSGRPVCPGETVPASAVNADSDHDRHLIESGALIEIADQAPKKSRRNSESTASTDSQKEQV